MNGTSAPRPGLSPATPAADPAAVYSAVKLFHHADQLAALSQGQVPAPVHVRIKPLNACNHDCWFCAYHAGHLELGSQMSQRDLIPKSKMNEICADLIAMQVKAVTFSGGGEPFLYPHLPEAIESLGAAGIDLGFITNGSRMEGALAEALAAHATWIRISADYWDAESFAQARRRPAAEYIELTRGLKAMVERAPQCTLGLSLIVHRDFAPHLAQVCTWAKDLGLHHVKVAACVVSMDPKEQAAYIQTFAGAVSEQLELAARLSDGHFAVLNHFHGDLEGFDRSYHMCPMASLLTVIGADLQVYTCQDKAYTESGRLASLTEQGFRTAWFASETQARLRAIDPALHCRHHCVAHSKNLTLLDFLNAPVGHRNFV